MSGFEICNFEEFVSEATPQATSLEEAASTQEILIQQIEGYLSRLKAALCSDMLTLENLTSDDFLQLTDTPNSYAGAALFHVRVNAAQNALEFIAVTGHRFRVPFYGENLANGVTSVEVMDGNTELGIPIARGCHTSRVAVKFRRASGAAPGDWTLRLLKNGVQVATFAVGTT
jgi:hypothetical protein